MADACGRHDRQLGVVIVSSGPGPTNTLTAWPMLVVGRLCCSSAVVAPNRATRRYLPGWDSGYVSNRVCNFAAKVHHIEALPQQSRRPSKSP
jgi:thiamine pyrophosphate-dependent acetolactate synthase large subunit-like protein